jgi:hypothetical protein
MKIFIMGNELNVKRGKLKTLAVSELLCNALILYSIAKEHLVILLKELISLLCVSPSIEERKKVSTRIYWRNEELKGLFCQME